MAEAGLILVVALCAAAVLIADVLVLRRRAAVPSPIRSSWFRTGFYAVSTAVALHALTTAGMALPIALLLWVGLTLVIGLALAVVLGGLAGVGRRQVRRWAREHPEAAAELVNLGVAEQDWERLVRAQVSPVLLRRWQSAGVSLRSPIEPDGLLDVDWADRSTGSAAWAVRLVADALREAGGDPMTTSQAAAVAAAASVVPGLHDRGLRGKALLVASVAAAAAPASPSS